MKKCKNCNKEIITTRSNQKFCSKECLKEFYIKQGKIKTCNSYAICKHCGGKFKQRTSNMLYCSPKCNQEHRRSKLIHYRQWLVLVEYCKERDNYKCVRCNDVENLLVHHVLPISLGGNNEYSNLITLCNPCHKKAHDIINNLLKEKKPIKYLYEFLHN